MFCLLYLTMHWAAVVDGLFVKLLRSANTIPQTRFPNTLQGRITTTCAWSDVVTFTHGLHNCLNNKAQTQGSISPRKQLSGPYGGFVGRVDFYGSALTSWDQYIEEAEAVLDPTETFLNELSDEQRTAATTMGKAVRVVAGPGSGKTRVLVARAAYLLALGIPPQDILILTFTNRAAGEVADRLKKLLQNRGHLDRMWVGTFHSVAARILRRHVEEANFGRTKEFQIVDESDSQKLILDVYRAAYKFKTRSTDSKAVKAAKNAQTRALVSELRKKAEEMQSQIAKVKEMLPTTHGLSGRETVHQYTTQLEEHLNNEKDFVWCFDQYQQKLRESNMFDFGDLQGCLVWLLNKHDNCLQHYRSRFKHVLVDEMQDTNGPQYAFLRLLVKDPDLSDSTNQLFSVGDPNQSIYAFRGAQMENMVNKMELDFEDQIRTLYLLDNYRSSPSIIRAAERILKRFIHTGVYDEMRVIRPPASVENIIVKDCKSDVKEAQFVSGEVRRLRDDYGIEYNEMAVLYRIHALSFRMESELLAQNIPCFVRSSSFWQGAEIKDVLAYLKFISSDRSSFERIYNKPTRGFGEQSMHNLKTWCENEAKEFPDFLVEDVLDAVSDAWTVKGVAIPKLPLPKEAKVSKKAQEGLHHLRQVFVFLRSVARRGTVEDTMQSLMKHCGLEKFIKTDPGNSKSAVRTKLNNLQTLIQSSSYIVRRKSENTGLKALETFVHEASSLVDAVDRRDKQGVQLMTMHSAKGLEFKAVFVIGCEEGVIPADNDFAQEARLLFVAMTRAEDFLTCTWAGSRFLYGKSRTHRISRFLV